MSLMCLKPLFVDRLSVFSKNSSKMTGGVRYKGVRVRHFVSMLTAAVIMHRLHLTDKDTHPDAPRSFDELLQSSDMIESNHADFNQDDIEKSKVILIRLCELERQITQEYCVPAFQLLGHGSFVEYLCDGTSPGPAMLYSLLTKSDMTVLQEGSGEKSTANGAQLELFSDQVVANAMLGALNDFLDSEQEPSYDLIDSLCAIEEGVCLALGCVQFVSASGGLSVHKYLSNLRRLHDMGEACKDVSSTVLAFKRFMSHFSTAMGTFDDSDGADVSHLLADNGEDELNQKKSDHFLNFNLVNQAHVDAEQDQFDSDTDRDSARNRVRYLLMRVPLGVSCVDYVMWDSFFKNVISSKNLLDFIDDEKMFLMSNRKEITYVAVSDTDVVAVCSAPPSLELLKQKLKSLHWSVIASWCLAATAEIIDKIKLRAIFQAEFLSRMENSGFHGITALLDICVSVSLSTSVDVRGVVLGFFIDVIAKCCDISVETVQTKLVEHLMQMEAKEERVLSYQHSPLWQIVRAACSSPSDRRLTVITSHRKQIYENIEMANSEGIPAAENILNVPNPNTNLCHEDEVETSLSQDNVNDAVSKAATMATAEVAAPITAATGSIKIDPQEAIARLLQSDFGYSHDGERPPQDSPVTVKLRNALEHLSTSLYCSDVHFVSELVQNADDNEYSPERKPTLLIQLYAHAVVIYNNEVGFSESNIIAICNVGGSTKKNQPGYIGQKGIG